MASRLVHWGWPQKSEWSNGISMCKNGKQRQITKLFLNLSPGEGPLPSPMMMIHSSGLQSSPVAPRKIQTCGESTSSTTCPLSMVCNSWCGNVWRPLTSNHLKAWAKTATPELPSRAGCSNMSKNQGWAHLNNFVLDAFHRFFKTGWREPKATLPAMRPCAKSQLFMIKLWGSSW